MIYFRETRAPAENGLRRRIAEGGLARGPIRTRDASTNVNKATKLICSIQLEFKTHFGTNE